MTFDKLGFYFIESKCFQKRKSVFLSNYVKSNRMQTYRIYHYILMPCCKRNKPHDKNSFYTKRCSDN